MAYNTLKYVDNLTFRAIFDNIKNFIVNNFATTVSISSIQSYYKSEGKNIDSRTIGKYIDILEKAKIIYQCEVFDIKSKYRWNKKYKYRKIYFK